MCCINEAAVSLQKRLNGTWNLKPEPSSLRTEQNRVRRCWCMKDISTCYNTNMICGDVRSFRGLQRGNSSLPPMAVAESILVSGL